jgi:hypothetical protein
MGALNMAIDASKVQWDAAPALDLSAVQWDQPQQSGIPAPRRAPSALTKFGRAAASLADVTVGGVIPGAVQYLAYPFARVGRSPEEAQAITQNLVSTVDKPFGKMAGVVGTPEYEQEAGRQIMDFIGQNFQKGAKFISEKTGMPVGDVESLMATATLTAPKVVPPVVRAVKEATAPIVEKAVVAAKMPFEKQIQARRERMSLEDYARGPQIDAIADAQRMKIALNPTDIESTIGAKASSLFAGEKGPKAIAEANKGAVRNVVLADLDLPPTSRLDGDTAFKEARANVAAPYEEVKKLPIQQADDAMIQRLEALRADLDIIGANEYAPAIGRIIDDAISKTQTGLTGEALLKNVSVLRERAKKTYDNKSATIEALDIADTNLKVATELESLIDNSISNPKLLEQYRDARQKMARSYAYQAATDFNTGIVDTKKLARITAKDNRLTGDIAALGRVAGNFPEVFTTKAATPWTVAAKIGRTGAMGTLGGLAGYQLGGGYTGAAIGSVLGAGTGIVGQNIAARRIASPGYQAGLNVRDMRLPINQLAVASAPAVDAAALGQQLNAAQTKIASLEGELRRAGDDAERQFITAQINRLQQYTGQLQQTMQGAAGPQNFTVVPPAAPAPVSNMPANRLLGYSSEVPPLAEAQMNRLRQEDILDYGFRQRVEAEQAAAAPKPKPATGEVILDFDPITGRFREASQGIKGATPDIFLGSTGKAAITAAEKMRAGQQFLMTAEEKIQWGKSLLEGMPVAQGETVFGKLSPQQITTKMADREWVTSRITKAREQAAAFEQIAARAQDERARQTAIAARERMMDLAEQMEEGLRTSRPDVSGKQQGPKTRAAKRNALAPDNQNKLAE